ncbi:MAG: methyltransferase domain-containing protein [Burkholderiales bacterium]
MEYQLRQGGRAATAFLSDLAFDSKHLRAQIDADLAARGLTDATMADDLDQRLREADAALKDSVAARAMAYIGEWSGINHGRIAQQSFEEMREDIEPKLKALEQGRTTLKAYPERPIPEYFKQGPWIHRTTGGWDGHPYQGFVHGELVHRSYVARNYGGNIYGVRRGILKELSNRDPQRIFEIGTSSGNFTLQLQQEFPKAKIVGCDLSLRMLEQAQRVGNENGCDWELHQLPGEATGFESGSFDLVAAFIIVHEVPAAITVAHLKEAFRLLRPGGEVLFSDAPRYSALTKGAVRWYEYLGVHGGEPFWRDAAVLDLGAAAREAGFVDVRSQGQGGAVYPWYVYGRKP